MQNTSFPELRFQPLSRQNSYSKRIIENQTMLNGHLSQKYFQKIRIVNKLSQYSILLHLILLHCYFETERQQKQTYFYFLWSSQICGVLTVASLIFRYKILKDYWKKIHKKEHQLLPVLVSCLFAIIMPYSFLQNEKIYFNNSFNNEEPYIAGFKLNYFLTVCSCNRIIPLVTAILINSKFSNPRVSRLCKMYGTFNGLIYSLKSIFKQKPGAFILTIFLSSVAVFSFTFRIAECEFISQDSLTAYMNMMWMTTITMTTVGFGDYTPCTPIGRLIGVVCMSWGVLIVSVMVGVLTQTLTLTSRETQSLVIFKRLLNNKQVKNSAGKYIRVSLWRLWKSWKRNISFKQDLKEREYKHNFRTLRLSRQLNRNVGCKLDIYNEMSRSFMQAEVDIDYLLTNYKRLINFISDEMIFTGDKQTQIKQSGRNYKLIK